jgi:hypothetical protein
MDNLDLIVAVGLIGVGALYLLVRNAYSGPTVRPKL